MTASTDSPTRTDPLSAARSVALATGLPYAGSITPQLAWQLVSDGAATLVDVRSAEELAFVGRVPGAIHVPWATGTSLTRNPRFVRELEAQAVKLGGKDTTLVLLCRSGKRSALAAEAATKAGLTNVFNVNEGFEGELDAQNHRGTADGWRHRGLPWTQG